MRAPRPSSLADLKDAIGWGECRRCGACCRRLIVEAGPVDVLREPRIAQECPVLDGNGTVKHPGHWSWSIAAGGMRRCPFFGVNLVGDATCSIYPSRPEDCVSMLPGGGQCAEARREEGLTP